MSQEHVEWQKSKDWFKHSETIKRRRHIAEQELKTAQKEWQKNTRDWKMRFLNLKKKN